MKKIICCTLGVFALSQAYAGNMGVVSPTALPNSIPFIAAEGSYTWEQTNSITFNNNTGNRTTQPWGGRLSAGIVHPFSDSLGFSAEIGGGYYGSLDVNFKASEIKTYRTIDAYDILVGAIYSYHQFDLLGKIGFMAQNYNVKVTQDYSKTIPGGLFSGVSTRSQSYTKVLPELKVGGIYNFNANWGASLAYMHAFGADLQGHVAFSASSGSFTINGQATMENPTLNSVMFGIIYNI